MVVVLVAAGLQACFAPPPRSHPTALGELWHVHVAVKSFAADHGVAAKVGHVWEKLAPIR
jgi:hypothetical protein